MADRAREILAGAAVAASFERPLRPATIDAIRAGDPDLAVEQLGFDSLALMEFCIAVELQSRVELTPLQVTGMTYVREVEDWLRGRLADE